MHYTCCLFAKTWQAQTFRRGGKAKDSAVAISVTMTDSAYQQAILLLDKATAIDSNYYRAYHNKMGFQMKLKQYDSALVTSNNLIRIRPAAPDIYFTCGVIYEKGQDTISSKKYFQKAQLLYDNILDTMSVTNRSHDILAMNRAIGRIMLGDEKEGNRQLQQLVATTANAAIKEEAASYINKNKRELLNIY